MPIQLHSMPPFPVGYAVTASNSPTIRSRIIGESSRHRAGVLHATSNRRKDELFRAKFSADQFSADMFSADMFSTKAPSASSKFAALFEFRLCLDLQRKRGP